MNSLKLIQAVFIFMGFIGGHGILNNAYANSSLAPQPLTSVGSLPSAFLNQDLPRAYDLGFSDWAYEDAVGSGNTTYENLLNQGLAFYHVFHYLDATRSFYQAIKEQPDSILARLGLAISIVKLGQDQAAIQESQTYFAQAQQLAKSRASIEESFWLELTGAYLENYLRGVSYNRDSSRSVAVIFKDYLNDQSDIEYLVLGSNMMSDISALNIQEVKSNYEKALSINPTHAGAVHYLTHVAEALDDKAGVIKYGELIAHYSKDSAHAQHMYGHNLPIEGKWAQAEEQFDIADGIHRSWAQENAVPKTYDWHYSHNLFLWGFAQVGAGMDPDRATDIMVEACKTNLGHCATLFFAVASYGYVDKLNKMVAALRQSNQAKAADFLQESIYWLGLEAGDASALQRAYQNQDAGVFRYYINIMLEGGAASVSDAEWMNLKSQILAQLTRTGFDSWSQVLPMVMLLRSVAVETNNTKVQSLVDSVYTRLNFQPAL